MLGFGEAEGSEKLLVVDSRSDPEMSDSADEFRLLRHCGRDGGSGGMRQLLEEIVGSQHHRSFSLDWPFEELTRCSLLNRIAQSDNDLC